jgi:hypothetical protein
MIVSIPQSLGGLEAPGASGGKEVAPSTSSPQPFHQAMDRALAKTPKKPDSYDPTQSSGSNSSQKREPSRTSAPAQQRPSLASAEASQNPSESSSTAGEDSSIAKARSRPNDRRDGSVTSRDNGLPQALPASLLLSAVPPPLLKLDVPSVTQGHAAARAQSALEVALPQGPPSRPQVLSKEPVLSSATETCANLPGSLVPAKDASARTQASAAQVPADGSQPADHSGKAPAASDSSNINPANPSTTPSSQGSASSEPRAAAFADGQLIASPVDGVQPKRAPKSTQEPTAGGIGKESPIDIGTSVAQQEMPMKKAEKVQKTAEPLQQKLPSDGALTAGQAGISAAQPASTSSAAEAEKLAIETNAGQVHPSAGVETQISPSVGASAAADARLASLERTHDLVATHALRLNQSGNDSLRVVIEPGGGTRLSLELRFGSGGIEAQAQLQRGDFQFFSSHWADLQQRLEPRGIHLGALGGSDQSGGGQERFQQSKQQPADEQPTRSAFAEFALDGPMADSPAARRSGTKTRAGWETWA